MAIPAPEQAGSRIPVVPWTAAGCPMDPAGEDGVAKGPREPAARASRIEWLTAIALLAEDTNACRPDSR